MLESYHSVTCVDERFAVPRKHELFGIFVPYKQGNNPMKHIQLYPIKTRNIFNTCSGYTANFKRLGAIV